MEQRKKMKTLKEPDFKKITITCSTVDKVPNVTSVSSDSVPKSYVDALQQNLPKDDFQKTFVLTKPLLINNVIIYETKPQRKILNDSLSDSSSPRENFQRGKVDI